MSKKKVDKKQVLDEEQFGSMEPTPQLIFVLDTVNFCFWAYKNKEKWTVEYPNGNFISNGFFALVAAIERAQKEGYPILDADFLQNMTLNDAKVIFRSSNETLIPLFEKRLKYLIESGTVLNKKYNGNIYNLLSTTGLDVGQIATKVVMDFPSYSDYSMMDNKQINYYKRAQIFAYDIGLLSALKAKNLHALTTFADYKIPQILRALGVTKYNQSLAKKLDDYVILEQGSREEIEIRTSTIWVCELIAHKAKLAPALVDNVLWKMSQSLRDVKPYHRVLTTSY